MCFLDLLQCFLYIRKLRVPSFYKRLHFTLLLSYSSLIITKIITSSIVIGFKNYFPLTHLSSCYRRVYYRTVCCRTVQ